MLISSSNEVQLRIRWHFWNQRIYFPPAPRSSQFSHALVPLHSGVRFYLSQCLDEIEIARAIGATLRARPSRMRNLRKFQTQISPPVSIKTTKRGYYWNQKIQLYQTSCARHCFSLCNRLRSTNSSSSVQTEIPSSSHVLADLQDLYGKSNLNLYNSRNNGSFDSPS